MRARRNDPCPCGSGKKYKQCHGASVGTRVPPEELAWRRVRRALDGHPSRMMSFIERVYGPDAIHEAWDAFTLWQDDGPPFDPSTPHLQVFLPWFFHHWEPDPADTEIEDPSLHGRSPTRVLLERRGGRLEPVLRRYLEACLEVPFSFHEVLGCEPGRSLRTRDLFTGLEHDVREASASRTLRVGDAFFGQVVSVDGVTVIESCSALVIPPRDKLALIDFREDVSDGRPFSTEMMRDWDIEVREAYLDLADHLLNPPPPRFRNTDGEDIVFHRLHFEIESPREAFDALGDLALDETVEELLEGADFEDGELRRATITWKVAGNPTHGGWENTVLGHIEIDGRELRAEVNSARRATRLRDVIEERLGERVRHVRTEVERVPDATDEEGTSAPATDAGERPGWLDEPEVLEQVRQVVAAHYESWVDESIPALGGLTPLEAVREPVGREKVEALIDDMERSGPEMRPPVDPSVFTRMRERLGLER